MKHKYRLFILGIVVLFITTLIIVDTYGLFETDARGNKEMDIAAWLNVDDVALYLNYQTLLEKEKNS